MLTHFMTLLSFYTPCKHQKTSVFLIFWGGIETDHQREMVNPFVVNAPFLYPLKTSENRKVFCFQRVEKGFIGNEWVKVKFKQNEFPEQLS